MSSYPFLLDTWSPFGGNSLKVLGIVAVLIVAVTIGLAHAYQSPRPQVIATFDYAYLIFAAFLGLHLFRRGTEPGDNGRNDADCLGWRLGVENRHL